MDPEDEVNCIYVGWYGTEAPDFFARPSSVARGRGGMRLESFVRMDEPGDDDVPDVVGCCNGLLLLEDHVANPATRRAARLPCFRRDGGGVVLPKGHEGVDLYWSSYLAFDPTVSPHYEVLSMQHPCRFNGRRGEGGDVRVRLEWPPPVYVMRAYSSRTGRLEERRFALDDGLQRSIHGESVRSYGHAAYWRGVLYVHCNTHFILRINLSDDKYQVIDLPPDGIASSNDDLHEVYYLGKSKNGIYYAAVDNDTCCRVLVWFLDESDGKAQWVFKHGASHHDLIAHIRDNPDAHTDRPWVLEDDGIPREFKPAPAVVAERNSDWDSDDDDDSAVEIKGCYCGTGTEKMYGLAIFGFHPYKEILFLHYSRAVAYHFGRSKVQDLGELGFLYSDPNMGRRAFVYTPCLVGHLSENSY